jgi:hypothetical protein
VHFIFVPLVCFEIFLLFGLFSPCFAAALFVGSLGDSVCNFGDSVCIFLAYLVLLVPFNAINKFCSSKKKKVSKSKPKDTIF